jgi:DNA-binding response OmpR family regulator
VTANAASDDIAHALELGVNSYILKPFTAETMREKIAVLLTAAGETVRPDDGLSGTTRSEVPAESGAPVHGPLEEAAPVVEPIAEEVMVRTETIEVDEEAEHELAAEEDRVEAPEAAAVA